MSAFNRHRFNYGLGPTCTDDVTQRPISPAHATINRDGTMTYVLPDGSSFRSPVRREGPAEPFGVVARDLAVPGSDCSGVIAVDNRGIVTLRTVRRRG